MLEGCREVGADTVAADELARGVALARSRANGELLGQRNAPKGVRCFLLANQFAAAGGPGARLAEALAGTSAAPAAAATAAAAPPPAERGPREGGGEEGAEKGEEPASAGTPPPRPPQGGKGANKAGAPPTPAAPPSKDQIVRGKKARRKQRKAHGQKPGAHAGASEESSSLESTLPLRSPAESTFAAATADNTVTGMGASATSLEELSKTNTMDSGIKDSSAHENDTEGSDQGTEKEPLPVIAENTTPKAMYPSLPVVEPSVFLHLLNATDLGDKQIGLKTVSLHVRVFWAGKEIGRTKASKVERNSHGDVVCGWENSRYLLPMTDQDLDHLQLELWNGSIECLGVVDMEGSAFLRKCYEPKDKRSKDVVNMQLFPKEDGGLLSKSKKHAQGRLGILMLKVYPEDNWGDEESANRLFEEFLNPESDKELRLQILRGAGLTKADRFGLSDPYCSVRLLHGGGLPAAGGDGPAGLGPWGVGGEELGRTRVCPHTLDPLFTEESFLIPPSAFKDVNESEELVVISVVDWDKLGSGDFLGQATLYPSDVRGLVRRRREVALVPNRAMKPKDSRYVGGRLVLTAHVVQKAPPRPRLRLSILDAEDLVKADLVGKSDPFCVVKWNLAEAAETEHLPRTLWPVWDNAQFDFPLELTQRVERYAPELCIEVYDMDRTGFGKKTRGEFLGQVTLRGPAALAPLLTGEKTAFELGRPPPPPSRAGRRRQQREASASQRSSSSRPVSRGGGGDGDSSARSDGSSKPLAMKRSQRSLRSPEESYNTGSSDEDADLLDTLGTSKSAKSGKKKNMKRLASVSEMKTMDEPLGVSKRVSQVTIETALGEVPGSPESQGFASASSEDESPSRTSRESSVSFTSGVKGLKKKKKEKNYIGGNIGFALSLIEPTDLSTQWVEHGLKKSEEAAAAAHADTFLALRRREVENARHAASRRDRDRPPAPPSSSTALAEDPAAAPEEEGGGAPLEGDAGGPFLHVHVAGARDLPCAEGAQVYVRVVWGRRELGRTGACPAARGPGWAEGNAFAARLGGGAEEHGADVLLAKAYAVGGKGPPEFLGQVRLRGWALLRPPAGRRDYPLEHEPGRERGGRGAGGPRPGGALCLALARSAGAAAAPVKCPAELSGPRRWVRLLVRGAAGLARADLRASDPFVRVYWNRVYVGQSRVVKNTLSPEWHASFNLEVFDQMLQLGPPEILLSVWDYDKASESDFLGEATLLGEQPCLNPDRTQHRLPLEDRRFALRASSLKIQGEISFELQLKVEQNFRERLLSLGIGSLGKRLYAVQVVDANIESFNVVKTSCCLIWNDKYFVETEVISEENNQPVWENEIYVFPFESEEQEFGVLRLQLRSHGGGGLLSQAARAVGAAAPRLLGQHAALSSRAASDFRARYPLFDQDPRQEKQDKVLRRQIKRAVAGGGGDGTAVPTAAQPPPGSREGTPGAAGRPIVLSLTPDSPGLQIQLPVDSPGSTSGNKSPLGSSPLAKRLVKSGSQLQSPGSRQFNDGFDADARRSSRQRSVSRQEMRLLTSAAGEDGKLTGELTELLRTHETLSRRASKSVDYSASADEVLRQLNRGKPNKHHVHLKSCVLSPPAWTGNVAVDKLVMSPKYGPRFPVLKIQFLRLFGLGDGLEMWAEFLWSGVSFGMVPLVNGCDVIIPYPEYWTQCTLAIDFFSDRKKSLPLGRALVHWSVFYELKFTIKEPQFSPLASAAQIPSQSSGQSSGESTGQDDGTSTGGPGGGGGVGGWRSFRLLEKLACPLTGRLAYKLTPRTAVLALRPEVAVPRPLSGELAPAAAAAAAAVPGEEEEDPGGEEAGRPTLPPRPESRGGGGGGGPRPPMPGAAAAAAASGSLEPDLYRLCLQIDGIHVREPPASPWESLASGTARGRGEGAGEAKEEEEEGGPGLLVGWHGGGGAAAAAGAGAEEGGGGGGEAGSPPSAGGGGQLAWLRAREGAMLRLPLAAPDAAGCTLALVAKRGARAVGACRFEGGELARLPVARTDWACRVSGLWPDKEGPPQISLALISPDSGPAQGSGWRRGLTRLSAGRLRVRVWVEASAPVAAPALQLQIHEVGRLSGRWGPGMTRVFGARRRRPYPKLLWFSGEHEVLGRPVTWDPVHIGQYTSVPPRVGLCSLPLGLLPPPAAATRAGAGGGGGGVGGGGGGGAPLLLPGEGRAPFLVLQLWDQGAMPREVLDALVRAQALVRTFLAVRQSARRAAARARRAAGRRRRARGARALQRVWRGHRARRAVLQLLVDAVARGAARHLQRAWRGFACRRRCAAFFRARRAQLLGAREVEVLVHVRRAVNLSSSVLGDIRARGAALGRVEPYCVITWNGEKIGETRVARNDATNPVWKDEIFGVSFHLPTLKEPFPDLELKLEVKNKSLLGGGFGQVILRAQDLAALVSVTAGVAAAAAGGGGGGEDPRAAPLAHQLLLGAEGYGGAAAKAGAERGARGAAYLQVQLTSARDLAAAYWPRAPRAEAEGGGWGWAAAAAADAAAAGPGGGPWAGAAARDAAARGAVGEVLRRVAHRLLPHGWSLRVVGAALRRKLDVYAVVYWEGIEIGRTPVSYNSKRPLWCEDGQTTGKAAEAHFNIPYPTCVDPILRIELWEKAQAKKSKVASLVGKVVLDVDQQKMLMKETASKAYHVFNQMEHSRVKTDLPLRKDGAVAAAAAGGGEGGEEVGVVLFADRTTMLEDHRRNPFDGSREADDPDRRSQTTASQPPREEEPPAASEGGEWARELDPESGAYYYAHAATGETRWEPPPGSAWARGAAGGEETGALVPYDYASEAQQYNDSALAVYNNEPAWEQVWSDEHQAYYWFRADTGESSWEDPSQLEGQQEAGEEDEEEEEEEGRAAVGEYYNEAGTRVIYFRK